MLHIQSMQLKLFTFNFKSRVTISKLGKDNLLFTQWPRLSLKVIAVSEGGRSVFLLQIELGIWTRAKYILLSVNAKHIFSYRRKVMAKVIDRSLLISLSLMLCTRIYQWTAKLPWSRITTSCSFIVGLSSDGENAFLKVLIRPHSLIKDRLQLYNMAEICPSYKTVVYPLSGRHTVKFLHQNYSLSLGNCFWISQAL